MLPNIRRNINWLFFKTEIGVYLLYSMNLILDMIKVIVVLEALIIHTRVIQKTKNTNIVLWTRKW